MSIELLCKAVDRMREDPDPRWHPVADWLEEDAAAWDFTSWPQSHSAVAVAVAYLVDAE